MENISLEEYNNLIGDIINKAVSDELLSVIIYKKMAEELNGIGNEAIRKHLLEHADSEYDHFKKIVSYAAKHDISNRINFTVDSETIVSSPYKTEDVVKLNQKLEMDAIKLYREAADISLNFGDHESYEFFTDLLEEEQEHYDDFTIFYGSKRSFSGSKITNFAQFISNRL